MTFGVPRAAPALCLVLACAGQSLPSSTHSVVDPSELYPLHAGNAWSYDVDTGEASTTLAIIRVEAFDGHIAEVHTGRVVVHYELLADGIRVPPGNEWLFRAPLVEGATWPARGGRTARLISTDTTAKTPVGTFDRCVEVLETGGKLELEVRTVYCPGVGPVSLGSTMRSNVSDRAVTVSAKLRGYDVSPVPSPDR